MKRFIQDLDDAPPSVEEYSRALKAIWPDRRDPDGDLAMLLAQERRGGRVTAQELARSLGYRDFIAANGRYGRFGHALADAMGIASRRKGGWYGVLSHYVGQSDAEGHFVWTMRREFRSALRKFAPYRAALRRVEAGGDESAGLQAACEEDLVLGGAEGERILAIRSLLVRDVKVAQRFVAAREAEGKLRCEACAFDAAAVAQRHGVVAARSLLDVHHRAPLSLGRRLTTAYDLVLLCPNCHRLEHAPRR